MAPSDPQSLDIHRVSPIRGQLENYDPRTPKGWRYIQTTDTPNELKVLLPPGTASMYEQLLKLENYELTKKPTISWERIMEIRHLKDRMIRKCHKLAKTSMPMSRQASIGDTFVFQTFVAPQDFRCKEMEKWFKEQQKRASSVPRKPSIAGQGQPSSSITIIKHVPSPSSKALMQRSVTNPESSSKPKQILYHKPLPIQPTRLVQAERTSTLPPSDPTALFSPPPLPLIILSQRESYGLEASPIDQAVVSDPPSPESPPMASGSETAPQVSPPEEPPLPEATPRPVVSRRSSLKRVSWADNQEIDTQLTKYVAAAREAQSSGKWEEVRALYLDQIAGLENLHLQVKEGLQHLRSETDHLQRIEETIRVQREALDSTFQQFEHKQTLLQEKVQEVLTEATDTLARHGVRRELEPINES
ncbi:hypothetical protein CVT24_000513 [Panaeolus cyanescens]|uniref:Uncharacterized protein n=1 Tax=Panaeolus cyanescens TaxID=181874 RepID=A0A409VAH6_9AGAR|nr:hypothetical protein CVT24_000513 [Panaeolus cyanescens]